DPRIRSSEVEDADPAPVRAPVVDQQGFHPQPALTLESVGEPSHLATEEGEALLLVEDRDDKRDQLGHQAASRARCTDRGRRTARDAGDYYAGPPAGRSAP